MKYLLSLAIVLFATTAWCSDVVVPIPVVQQLVVQQPVQQTQVMVYYSPYYTVTVPVQVAVTPWPPVPQVVYWGYPYQPVVVNNYWPYRCRLRYGY